jgi:ribosomal-protein-serine acetyltransferase
MEQFEIRVDEDIVLRLRKIEDAQELFDFVDKNRSYLREWLGWLDFTNCVLDTEKFILECQKNYKNGIGLNLAIYYNEKMVGSIGFNTIDRLNKNAGIGYMLDEDMNGKGIMTKSCRGIINHGFNEMTLNRIEIKAAVENTKSRAIPEKLGFKQEGILHQAEFKYDHFLDMVVYGMLKENWK